MGEDDAALLASLRARDPRALGVLYERHHARVHGFLLRLSRDATLATDLAQETWLRLAAHAPHLAPDSEPRAWLFSVARNLYRSHRRWLWITRRRETEVALLTRQTSEESSATSAQLERALAALPVAHREVLLLVGVEGFSPEQAARVLALSPEATRKRLSRARAALREILGDPA